jgi:cell division septum initiation protein DivIVA
MERLRSELLNQFRGVLGNYEHSMLQLVERQSRKRMESLLEHNEQLKRQNAELELQLRTLRSSHESASQQAASAHKELSVIRARVQLTDSKVATLTEQLQLKTHENSKLTQLCDELIANLEAAQAQ